MKFTDKGIIIAIKNYGEKSLIVKIFSQNYGVCKGFVKYASGKNSKVLYQIGNIIKFDYASRVDDSLGSFMDCDIDQNIVSKFILDKLRLNCAKSIIAMLDDYLLEHEEFTMLYGDVELFFKTLGLNNYNDNKIVANYIKLELSILKCLGYGIDFSSCVVTNSRVNLAYVSPKSAHAVSLEAGAPYAHKLLKLPNFLLNEDNFINSNHSHLIDGLNLSGYFIKKFLFNDGKNKNDKNILFYRDHILKIVSDDKIAF